MKQHLISKRKSLHLQRYIIEIQKIEINQNQKTNKRFFSELNSFRKNPTSIIPFILKRKLNYSVQSPNQILFSPNQPHKGIKTKQGPTPISQLLQSLHARDKMPAVQQNLILSEIAQKVISWIKEVKTLEEIKLTEQMAKELRIQLTKSKEYNFIDKIYCLIGIGFDKDSYEPLISLLIDDGFLNRQNRKLIFNDKWRFAGIATDLLTSKPQLRVCVYLFTCNIYKK